MVSSPASASSHCHNLGVQVPSPLPPQTQKSKLHSSPFSESRSPGSLPPPPEDPQSFKPEISLSSAGSGVCPSFLRISDNSCLAPFDILIHNFFVSHLHPSPLQTQPCPSHSKACSEEISFLSLLFFMSFPHYLSFSPFLTLSGLPTSISPSGCNFLIFFLSFSVSAHLCLSLPLNCLPPLTLCPSSFLSVSPPASSPYPAHTIRPHYD